MRLIAHRGFAGVNPENTVAAIRDAAEVADAVEFDVRRCGSGELVVVHDETLERLTGDESAVADLTLAQLQSTTVLDSTERIPTLEAVLEVLPADVAVNLELKATGIAGDVLAALETSGVPNRVVCTSFHQSELRAIRDLDPGQPTGLLADRSVDRPVATAVDLGCDVLGVRYWRCLVTRLPNRTRAAGLELHAWGVPNALVARLLGLRGVDAASADRPIRV